MSNNQGPTLVGQTLVIGYKLMRRSTHPSYMSTLVNTTWPDTLRLCHPLFVITVHMDCNNYITVTLPPEVLVIVLIL